MAAVDWDRQRQASPLLVAQVIWTDGALADIDRAVAYVSQFRPVAALHLADRLLVAGYSLADDAERGRPLARGRRELTIIYPYLIRYRIKGDTVTILEVRHGARRPPRSSGLKEEASIFDLDDEEADERTLAAAEADVAAGRVISHDAVARWLLSIGTPNELPAPRCGE